MFNSDGLQAQSGRKPCTNTWTDTFRCAGVALALQRERERDRERERERERDIEREREREREALPHSDKQDNSLASHVGLCLTRRMTTLAVVAILVLLCVLDDVLETGSKVHT